ncbi:MAG: hypothetical protein IJ167_06670 [Lachnospiraceae bacterium]|nr:hypothetical protein [Lachnospiraceae bacterium]
MFLKTKTNSITKDYLNKKRDGYRDTIQKGLDAMSYRIISETGSREDNIKRLKKEIETADAIIIGAGAGLSTSAGFTYSGERFEKYFFDFAKRFGIRDMYSGGFYPFPDEETLWAWWSRHIYFNRYIDAPKPVYKRLYELVDGRKTDDLASTPKKDYFVITTNVDHQFQRAGFDKKRLFYTQGDYGLFQSVNSKLNKTYDNEEWVMKAMESQGFVRDENGVFQVPEDGKLSMRIPTELIPKCPDDGSDVTMNLRADDTFVEDEGWKLASSRYSDFLRRHEDMHVLYLELGVGANTPVIIKYPFWQMTAANLSAVYACINYGEAFAPEVIKERAICIDGDIGETLNDIV